MTSVLRSTSLFYWKDDTAELKAIFTLAGTNIGLYLLSASICNINSDQTVKLSEVAVSSFLSCVIPFFACVLVIIFGFKRAADDSVAKIARSALLAWFLSLFLFLHNAIYAVSIVYGPWRGWLNIESLSHEYQYLLMSLAYGSLGPVLMAFWTRTKGTALGWQWNRKQWFQLILMVFLLTLVNSSLFYSLLFSPEVRASISSAFKVST